MTRYGADTTVSAQKSRAEIEATLRRYGATSFAYAEEGHRAAVMFTAHDRRVRFILSLPSLATDEVQFTPTRLKRSPQQAQRVLEQLTRQRWRALVLAIKAKLEVVESGIETFDEAFAVHMVLPDNTTVGEWLVPQIDEAYRTREMPALLPGLNRPRLALEP